MPAPRFYFQVEMMVFAWYVYEDSILLNQYFVTWLIELLKDSTLYIYYTCVLPFGLKLYKRYGSVHRIESLRTLYHPWLTLGVKGLIPHKCLYYIFFLKCTWIVNVQKKNIGMSCCVKIYFICSEIYALLIGRTTFFH